MDLTQKSLRQTQFLEGHNPCRVSFNPNNTPD